CTGKRYCQFADEPPGSYVTCPGGLPPGPCDCRVADMCSLLSGGKPTICAAVGECSQTHVDCPEVGKPCAGSTPDDASQPLYGHCNLLGDSCAAPRYEELIGPSGDLPGAAKPVLDRLDLTALQAGFTSPTTAAVTGALKALAKRAAMPNAR